MRFKKSSNRIVNCQTSLTGLGFYLTRLVDIFQSKMQTRLVEYLLANRSKVFNQAALARYLNCSPSTIARIIEPLIREQILTYERFNQGMKVLCLNLEEEKTRILVDFYEKLKTLQDR